MVWTFSHPPFVTYWRKISLGGGGGGVKVKFSECTENLSITIFVSKEGETILALKSYLNLRNSLHGNLIDVEEKGTRQILKPARYLRNGPSRKAQKSRYVSVFSIFFI